MRTVKFTLKRYDTPLLTFSASMDSSDPEIAILWHDPEQEAMLPLDLELTPESLSRWLRHRTIPKNRAYVHSLLAKCGLNLNRPMNIISICKGLSLNDCYWIVEEGYAGSFSQNNLYENPMSNVLAAMAFTGYGSSLCASFGMHKLRHGLFTPARETRQRRKASKNLLWPAFEKFQVVCEQKNLETSEAYDQGHKVHYLSREWLETLEELLEESGDQRLEEVKKVLL